MKKRVLSGMRPTGKLHLGHLVGALNNWVRLQDDYECYFMIADWHALMSEYEAPKGLAESAVEVARDWIAAGLDPQRCTLFIQSHVPEHLELAMIFADITPLAWVERCPTYKEQLREVKGRELATYGFLGYPVLQAADIALYRAHLVPVGIDQMPHLELTREIVRRFNGLYGEDLFPEPEGILTTVPKLLGLDNRKMSKSYGNCIYLSDPPETIGRKVSQMITDPKRIRLADRGHPDVCTVFSYYGALADAQTVNEVKGCCLGSRRGCTDCKKALAALISDALAPLRKRSEGLTDEAVRSVLEEGTVRATRAARETMIHAKRLVNLPPEVPGRGT